MTTAELPRTLPRRALWLGPCAMALAVALWGGAFVVTKHALASAPPFGFAVLRFALALVGLAAFAVVTRRRVRVPKSAWPLVVGAGLLGTTATYALENAALTITTATNSALFIAASPLLTLAGAALFLKERLGWRQLVGAALAAVGMWQVIGGRLAETGLGDALMAAATVVGAVFALQSKRLAMALDPLSALLATYAVGLAGLLPFVAFEAWQEPGRLAALLAPASLGAGAYLAWASSGLGYGLWMFALARMPVSQTGLYLYAMPLVTLALSALTLGEPIGLVTALGALAILGGVALATTKPAA